MNPSTFKEMHSLARLNLKPTPFSVKREGSSELGLAARLTSGASSRLVIHLSEIKKELQRAHPRRDARRGRSLKTG